LRALEIAKNGSAAPVAPELRVKPLPDWTA